jgi:hypothetical protein
MASPSSLENGEERKWALLTPIKHKRMHHYVNDFFLLRAEPAESAGIPEVRATVIDQKAICSICAHLLEQLGEILTHKIMAMVIIDKLYDELIDAQFRNEEHARVDLDARHEVYIVDCGYIIDRFHISFDGKRGLRFSGTNTGAEEKEIILEKIRNLYVFPEKCVICTLNHRTNEHVCYFCGKEGADSHEPLECPERCVICSGHHQTSGHKCFMCGKEGADSHNTWECPEKN